MKRLLSGNEAIAHGAHAAGAKIGCGYPGTPSTEAMETFAAFDDVYAEWSVNEKVALEVALGASAAGARSFVTMKHVGVNVAADPLFTSSYTGVGAGLVVLCADDPGMYSSQNEQDSHYYAQAASVLMLEPADSQEAFDFTKAAFALSERFDTPVFIRSSVRISHTRTPVDIEASGVTTEAEAASPDLGSAIKPYETDISKWVMMPAFARGAHVRQIERTDALREWVETCDLNACELRDTNIGVICAGAAYQHVRDALPDASTFKLGVSWPLPRKELSAFASQVDKVYVVEEASSYLSDAVCALGIKIESLDAGIPACGELSPEAVRKAFGIDTPGVRGYGGDLPARPPALCPGCPHRIPFAELSRIHAIVTGDIGCYTLGALPPLSSMDTCVDMGASVSMSHGFELARSFSGDDSEANRRPVVAVIGDSTFAHSGLISLLSTAYNKGSGTICVLDNRTTAMTGRQGNPFNGVTLQNRESREMDIEAIVRALGIGDVSVVDSNDRQAVRSALKNAVDNDGELSVIVFKRPCILLSRERHAPYSISDCRACGACLRLGCPAIGKDPETGFAYIDKNSCVGCGQCAQYCAFAAISQL